MNRRTLIKSAAICTALATTLAVPAKGQPASGVSRVRFGPFVEVADGTRLFYRDWGEGARPLLPPVGAQRRHLGIQLTELSDQGVRCIAYDRCGHGRSDHPGRGYDFPTLATDLRDVTLVGYSMGSAEAIHYISRCGKDRISRLVLVSPLAPAHGQHSMNDHLIAALKKDRPAAFSDGLPLFSARIRTPRRRWLSGYWSNSCSLHRRLSSSASAPSLPTIIGRF
jgi:non-heme chloroperoxidase